MRGYCGKCHQRDIACIELIVMTVMQAFGGPPLVSDHEMVIDCEAQMIYVSGGRILDGDRDLDKACGLYCYDIRANKWKKFQ